VSRGRARASIARLGAAPDGKPYTPHVLGEVLTAIVTPFRADGSVDADAFRELAGFLVDNGSDGIVVAGTTGESPTLSDEEKLDLFAVAVDAVGDRATVIAGTGTYDTAHSAHLTGQANGLGVDGYLVVTPYYNKPPQRAIVRHFEEIAAATDKPIVAYNIPARVIVNIEPATIARLAEIPNLAAVKQAYDDLDEARFIAQETRLDLYSGDDPITFAFLELGGVGVVSVASHVWGPQIKEMIRRYRDGDVEGARALNGELAPAYDLLRIQTNPIPIKAALRLVGHAVGGHRLPMVEPSDEELEQVRACLARAGMPSAV
jgi:4-hydroxy-tetrahydrodipicolinate synthase